MISIVDIPALPVTLANEHKVRPVYDRLRTFMQERNAVAMMRTIARLRAHDPMLGELIDEVGRPSAVWMAKQVQTMLDNDAAFREHQASESVETSAPLAREMADATAKADHARIMAEYFRGNPEVARQLYFDFGAFPVSLEGLKVGIDAIRECADYDALERTHGANAANMARSNDEAELWQNATAAEVADWVNRFCGQWQP